MVAIAEVLPAAVALALVNPLPVIAVILLLLAPRGRSVAASFLAGWFVGLSGILAILVFVVPIERLVGGDAEPTVVASVARLVIGGALLAGAVRKWRSRPARGEDPKPPGWMASLARATPLAAFGIGVLLAALNPKNAAFTVAAAGSIGEADPANGAKLAALVAFVVVGSIGVVLPPLWAAFARHGALRTLDGWRSWLTANYATMMTVVFLLFGVYVLSKGLTGLLK